MGEFQQWKVILGLIGETVRTGEEVLMELLTDTGNFSMPGQELSILKDVPLLLEVRHNQIVEGNCLQPNEGLDKWKIGKFLGGGASGRVYKALNVQNGVISAVKKVTFLKGEDNVCRDQIGILTKLHHQNIVKYLQHYHFEDETWIFMEYVPQTLQEFYKQFGPAPHATFLNFARQLVGALNYLHSHKVVHKDIKCENVLLTSRGTLKLTDYGCSKGFDRTLSFVNYELQLNKTQKGTPNWMAPESITDSQYTRKSDVWSLGCTLLELATAHKPWAEQELDAHRIILHIGTTEDVPLIPKDLNRQSRELIERCLKRNPQERATTEELLKLLFSFE